MHSQELQCADTGADALRDVQTELRTAGRTARRGLLARAREVGIEKTGAA